ncbi:MAG TPA: TIR domain-containing protein [Anaerolineales bacterium]|nr:TIR domain-containing protein [Anaerolineales bacterium]
MTHANHDPFEYDVALSFAGEDRAVAEEFAKLLIGKNINVFYDEYKTDELWGKDWVDHLVNLYARKARYCVMLISQYYPLKQWTEAERTSATQSAFREADEYILPIRLDETEVPGIMGIKGYRDLRQHSMESIVNSLEEKLNAVRGQAGPPPQSHDLRSGNIPSKRQ